MIPWSAPGSQWSRTALTVATITGTAAPTPAASVIRCDPRRVTRGGRSALTTSSCSYGPAGTPVDRHRATGRGATLDRAMLIKYCVVGASGYVVNLAVYSALVRGAG